MAGEKSSVASGNKVVDSPAWHSLWGVPLKNDVDSRVSGRLLPQCAPDAKGFLSDVYKRSTLAKKLPADGVQCGRSMIEMLGVLAIIAVLTTGGIAGYSKAMEKFKVNKTISEYNTLMFGFFQHLDDIRKTNVDSEDYNSLFVALDMVPKSWSLNGQYFVDDMGNYIRIYPTYIEIMFNYLGKAGGFKKNSFCRNLFELAKGYQNELKAAYIWKAETAQDTIYYGNRYCGDNIPCIRNMTFNEIDKQCQICNKLDVNTCSLVLSF